ncbi:MAG: nucleoside deaminase [Oscillospiraceae bacterium]|nr:nucleoside deaminase [Oscillospiraceae bacterium]
MKTHEDYMLDALCLAKEAGDDLEAPVGCVIVNASGDIIGRGRNRREKQKSATAHAEIEAIENACKALDDWRLSGCSLYVTLEPCPMCAGAIIMSRIDKVFYGARDEITGSCGSVINLFMEEYGQKTKVTGGILEAESALLLSVFFENLRSKEQLNPTSLRGATRRGNPEELL